jgi:hypothetical protein
LQERFLLIQSGVQDEYDELKEEIDQLENYCEETKETLQTQIANNQDLLKTCQTKLAEATEKEATAGEKGRSTAAENEKLTNELEKQMATCSKKIHRLRDRDLRAEENPRRALQDEGWRRCDRLFPGLCSVEVVSGRMQCILRWWHPDCLANCWNSPKWRCWVLATRNGKDLQCKAMPSGLRFVSLVRLEQVQCGMWRWCPAAFARSEGANAV